MGTSNSLGTNSSVNSTLFGAAFGITVDRFLCLCMINIVLYYVDPKGHGSYEYVVGRILSMYVAQNALCSRL